MVKINVYGADHKIIESTELSEQPVYNNPKCKHPHPVEVDDPMEGVKAYKCFDCNLGWLIRDKIKEEKK